jgi:fibro-slime domain-containing protein
MRNNWMYLSALSIAAMVSNVRADVINLTGTIRDMLYNGTPAGTYNGYPGVGNVDFENVIADDRGIVTSTLGVDGTPVYDSVAHSGGTTTTFPETYPTSLTAAEVFYQWYHDVPGVNVSKQLTIPLTNIGGGIYEYNNQSFFPIDGQLFGDQSDGHNFSFTFALHTQFTYEPGQNFGFAGDDDVWVYINDKLVIDLGGVHGTESANVNLDSLGLTTGQTYPLDVFFAERHTTGSDIRIDTSIVLQQSSAVPLPAAAWSGLVVLGGMVGRRILRRRQV